MSAPNVNKMGCPFYFHTSRVRLKRKYLFRLRKKEIIILHSTKAHVRCTIQQNGSRLRKKEIYRRLRKKEIIILHSTKAHVRCTIQQNGSQSESTIETSGCVTVFEDLNNFVDMNGSIYR